VTLAPETFARRHLRHNFVALSADFGLFLVGLSFASQSTILPAFASRLGASNLLIGAIPAVMTAGWFFPSLFVAGHTEALRRKLPFVLRYTLWERVPFLVLAGAAFLLADHAPELTLAVFYAMLLLIAGSGGFLMPAWMDMVGRAIPVELRGRFFALSSVMGAGGGLLGSVGTAWVLGAVAAPASYGICFLGAALCMGLSYLALALVKEPPAAAAPRIPLRAYLGRIPALLRRERNLARFLTARGFIVAGQMGGGFYTVYALRAFAPPESQVGVFTTALMAGQMAGNVAFGWIADRAGHRLVLLIGSMGLLAANLLALGAPSVRLFTLVFACFGVQLAAGTISAMPILLEFAPAVEERPTYVGLGNTLVAPVLFTAPLVGGLLAEGIGFPAVFAVSASSAAVGLGLLLFGVSDPRWARRGPRERLAV
jgi:MFS family permease